MKNIELFSDMTPGELKILISTLSGGTCSKETREKMSLSARRRWEGMSNKEKDSYLKKSFHSEESRGKAEVTTRKIWKNKTPEEIENHVRSSFLSPKAIAASGRGYSRFINSMTEEEKKSYNKDRLESIIKFWESEASTPVRIHLGRKSSKVWSSKSPEEKLRWLEISCHSSEARIKAKPGIIFSNKIHWSRMTDSERRMRGKLSLEGKLRTGNFGGGNKVTWDEYFLGLHLEGLYPNRFRYNGCGPGSIAVGTRRPDFISRNGEKIVVELFGSYWHSEDEVISRIEHYRKYGYKCVVIWDYENFESTVKERLDNVKSTELSSKEYIGLQSVTEGGD